MRRFPAGHGERVENTACEVVASLRQRAGARLSKEADAYADQAPDERPLAGYAALFAIYAAFAGLLGAIVAWRRPPLAERVGAGDVLLLAVATHKLARIASKDAVTSFWRAPFTSFSEPGGVGEVHEQVRGAGLRHAVGELVTCPFCLGQWIATLLVFALVMAPRLTRWAATVFAVVAGSDLLQLAFAKARQSVS